MKAKLCIIAAIFLVVAGMAGCGIFSREKPVVIVSSANASARERLAAREIRRYVYQRSGRLLEIVTDELEIPKKSNLIVVASKDREIMRNYAKEAGINSLLDILLAEHYLLKTITREKQRILLVSGDEAGTLFAAYRFAEHLGVRFFLHGDVIPDGKIKFELTDINQDAKPLFELRGIQPFHDFPEGPDLWNADDYKAVFSQLPKLGMNFFGLHCYPEGGVGPEPSVWIGLAEDYNDDGTVNFSYPSRWFNTLLGSWGYAPEKTGDFVFGGGRLFEYDGFGSDVMREYSPWPETPEEYNALFNTAGDLLEDSFDYARMLGIKTCLGTETPLTVPKLLRDRLREKGKNPDDISVVRELYEGMFGRIKKTYDLDYYWFWTPEDWIWGGNTEEDINATKNDLLAAVEAAENVDAPFTLATCGWVLGPQSDRSLFDTMLPREMPLSSINRFLGVSPVDKAFERIYSRPKWAIPWMEDDPNMISPQLWAGRMRADAVGALSYECTGLIGIHWRTRILGPNVSALANAAWDQGTFIEKPLSAGPAGENVEEFTSRYNADGKPIAGTEDDTLYQTVRHELYGYRLEVPDGNYAVTLKFCETLHEKKGLRVFGVKLQDTTVLNDLDIFEQAGKLTALDLTFEDIAVTDGILNIDFVRKFDYPTLAAIDIAGNDFSLKINCGGPVYNDYAADWDKAQPRDLAVDDFYADWALAQFGPETSAGISKLFADLDGRMPRPSAWIAGPGSLYPDERSWEYVSAEYDFTSEMEQFRSQVTGAGNLERFDYWLNNFRYMKAMAQFNCALGVFNTAMETVGEKSGPDEKADFVNNARNTALPAYKDMVSAAGEAYGYLLSTVSTYGEIGNVINLDTHSFPRLLDETGAKLSEALGVDLPDEAVPSKEYAGSPKLIVPTVRTSVMENEPLRLKVIVLDNAQPSQAELYWRPMGMGEFTAVPLTHVNRGVYSVELPAGAGAGNDFEYYVKTVTAAGGELYFPATAPELNQTVVVLPGS
ncbi:malectin domain-containing carbohydrate-binding protein [Candidatus Latescibacterota bacterium]